MKKVINILVSILFLIGFIGVNIHKHYSHGKLYSIAFFQEAESCCVDMESCEMAETSETCNTLQKDDCSCEDTTERFKISDFFVDEKYSISTIKKIDLYFVSLFLTRDASTLFTVYNNTNIFPSPPLKKTDVQSEFGVFLI